MDVYQFIDLSLTMLFVGSATGFGISVLKDWWV